MLFSCETAFAPFFFSAVVFIPPRCPMSRATSGLTTAFTSSLATTISIRTTAGKHALARSFETQLPFTISFAIPLPPLTPSRSEDWVFAYLVWAILKVRAA